MFISIPVIVLLAGLGMIFLLGMRIKGGVTAAVGLVLMGAVYIPVLSPAVAFVKDLF